MRVDAVFLLFRLLIFSFIMTLVVLVLYVLGTYQSFQEVTLETLFQTFRVLSWSGLVLSATFQVVLWSQERGRLVRTLLNSVMFILFGVLYILVEFLKAWLYPGVAQ